MKTDKLPRLYKKYREEVTAAMMKTMNYANVLEVPRVLKVVINIGLGEGASEFKLLEDAHKSLQPF